jgi:hypothetical protein
VSFFDRSRARLVDALARYLAQPVVRVSKECDREDVPSSAALRIGDVLLTSGNTRAAVLVRLATGSPWAHVSVYVGPLEQGPDPLCVVEADISAGVRAIRLSQLSGQRVRVLRPTELPEAERRRIAEWMIAHIGDGYDIASAWALTARLLRLPWARRLPSPADVVEGARRFICSTLVAQAFVLVGYHILPLQVRAKDTWAGDHRHVVPRDFERASGFEVVGRG